MNSEDMLVHHAEVITSRRSRLDEARDKIALRTTDMPDLTTSLTQEALGLWTDVLEAGSRYVAPRAASPADLAHREERTYAATMSPNAIDTVIDQLRTVDLGDPDAQRQVVMDTMNTLEREMSNSFNRQRQFAEGLADEADLSIVEPSGASVGLDLYATMWRRRRAAIFEGLRTLSLLDAMTLEAELATSHADAAVARVNAARVELADVEAAIDAKRALRAGQQLADQFRDLAKREHRTSWVFRGVTTALLTAAVVWTFCTPSDDLTESVAHLAVALAGGALATYTGRLASLHRGTADWAKSIEVQLNTFEGFLNTVPSDEVKSSIYEDFAHRVFGTPPLPGNASESVSLAELVSVLRRE